MTGYELSRNWFDWAFENPDLVNSNDTALFMWLIEKNNRCGWSEKFSITSTENMLACGFRTYPPYKKSFDKLVEFGFIEIVRKSQNQYQTNIIAISKNEKATTKALDKALLNHSIKHVETTQESNSESTFDINKQQTSKPETKKPQTNKPISDLKKSVHPSFSFIKNAFLSYYLEQKKLNYNWQPIDGTKTNSIIKKILFQVKTTYPDTLPENEEKKINDGFIFIIKNLNDNWIIENLSLAIIDSKFNTIISKIKNPTKNGQSINHLEQRRAEILSKYNPH